MSLRVRGASGKGGEGRVRTRITTLWRPRSVASCKMSRTLTTRWSSQCCSTSLSMTTSQGAMRRRNCLLVTFACCSVAPSIVAVSLTGTRSTPVYETPPRFTFEIQWRSPHPRSVRDAATSLRQSPSRKLARGFAASIELPALGHENVADYFGRERNGTERNQPVHVIWLIHNNTSNRPSTQLQQRVACLPHLVTIAVASRCQHRQPRVQVRYHTV